MNEGVQSKVPLVLAAFTTNVAPVGSGAPVNETMERPSLLLAVTTKCRGQPGPVSEGGADTMVPVGTFTTVMLVVAISMPPLPFAAVNVTE